MPNLEENGNVNLLFLFTLSSCKCVNEMMIWMQSKILTKNDTSMVNNGSEFAPGTTKVDSALHSSEARDISGLTQR